MLLLYLENGYGDHNFFNIKLTEIQLILKNYSQDVIINFISQYQFAKGSFVKNADGENVIICDLYQATEQLNKSVDNEEQSQFSDPQLDQILNSSQDTLPIETASAESSDIQQSTQLIFYFG